MYVRVKHVKVSALKNKYYIKNTAAAGVGFTITGVWSVYVYIFYTARGDQVKYNLLFGKREGWGVWSSWWNCFSALEYAFTARRGTPLVVLYPSCGILSGRQSYFVCGGKEQHSILLSRIEPQSSLWLLSEISRIFKNYIKIRHMCISRPNVAFTRPLDHSNNTVNKLQMTQNAVCVCVTCGLEPSCGCQETEQGLF